MLIERWMYMTRRSLDTVRVAYSILIVVVTCPVPIAVLRLLQVLYGTHELLLNTISFILFFLCFFATSIAYFKVWRVITHHQEQVQGNAWSQNFPLTTINLAKYKKSVFSILFIVVLFYINYLPFLVFVGLNLSQQNNSEVALAFSMIFMFLSFLLNPLLCV